jgi:hypothetical protein
MFDQVTYRTGFVILGTLALALVAFGGFLLRDLSARADDYQ